VKDTHGHPVLTWYDYDEVHRIEVRQGDKKIDRFYGYETEEDIKRQLRQNEIYGEFEVIGIDSNGNYLPHRGELVVARPGRPLKGLLARTQHYRGEPKESSDGATKVLEHEAERQRQAARERERMMRRSEELYEERLEERERLFEERRRELEEIAEEKARTEAERAALIEEQARQQIEGLQRQSSTVLDQLKSLYDDKMRHVEQSSDTTQTILTTTLTAQVKQAQSEAALWRERFDRIEATYERHKREERDREDRLRSDTEREREQIRQQLLDEKERTRERIDQAEEKMRAEHKSEMARLEDRIEALKEEREGLKAEIIDLKQQLFQVGLTTQFANKGGLSDEAKELRDLLSVAREHEIDVKEIVRDRLGLPEVEKTEKGPLDAMIQGLLPKILGDQLPGSRPGGNQGSSGSSLGAANQGSGATEGLTLEPI